MAVVDVLSTALENTYDPRTRLNSSQIDLGRARQSVGVASVDAGDDDTSVYRICRVHSSWRISSIRIVNSAITGGTAYSIGVYNSYSEGDSPVEPVTDSKELFAATVDMSSARGTPTEVLSIDATETGVEEPIWQRLGLTSDPGEEYDLALTGATVGTAGGFIGVQVDFVGIG